MRFDVISLFAEAFKVVTDSGVTGRAHRQGIWSLNTWNPRNYTHNVHQTVDDRPYGGGPGMVMLAQPLVDTLNDVRAEHVRLGLPKLPVVLLSPAGRVFDQSAAESFSQSAGMVLVCGRYEGIDQRFIKHYVDVEISIGDFVLSGGELAALPLIDAIVRLLPGVLNAQESALQDSFHSKLGGLLDSEHYTRPEVFENECVPDILMSGHHLKIAQWRRQRSLALTSQRRPDLIKKARLQCRLSEADEQFLSSLGKGEGEKN